MILDSLDRAIQWVEYVGSCRKCGKPATAIGRNAFNAVTGIFCKRHGDQVLKLVQAERKKLLETGT